MDDLTAFRAWCPEKTRESLLEAVQERWQFVGEVGWPIPRGDWVECRVCGSDDLHYSHVSFATRGNSTLDHRAELQLKCTDCSAKNSFGIPITEEHIKRLQGETKTWRYRDIIDWLEK